MKGNRKPTRKNQKERASRTSKQMNENVVKQN